MIGANATISVYKLQEVSGKETYSTADSTGVDCYKERIQPELATFWDGGGDYEVYRFITDEVLDVKETDRLVDQDSNTFTVKGIQQFEDNIDTDNHTEIIAFRTYVKA